MRDGRFSLKDIPQELREAGLRFVQHRHNAELRSVEWKFTFDQWWKVWQDSGRWAERGWGAEKYCMCRFGDAGPYAVGNVFIATNSENSSSIDRSNRRVRHQRRGTPGRELPANVRSQAKGTYYATKSIKGIQYHVGTFASPELARAAYENFSV
jgi:hypothetical protein